MAPAFDINPNVDKAEHVLNIDDVDNRPSQATVSATAVFYGLSQERGDALVEEVASAVDGWRAQARRARIIAADIASTAAAFAAHHEYRQAR